jgi:hypothetical protein
MTTSDKIAGKIMRPSEGPSRYLSTSERQKLPCGLLSAFSRVSSLGNSIIPSFCHASVKDKAPLPCD